MKSLSLFKNYLIPRSYEVLEKAQGYSQNLCDKIKKSVNEYCHTQKLDPNIFCLIVVGSVGRDEALEASDVDIIPVIKDGHLKEFELHDQKIREKVQEDLKLKVSKGEDLTKYTEEKSLIELDSIGGDKDNNSQLTKRILILTEGQQVGGGYDIKEIKKKILDAYSKNDTTSGRHVLTLCNDIARYYRTLCIEYKAKIDVANKDWCTRNAKLRHSRKVWYFSSFITIVRYATKYHSNPEEFNQQLLEAFQINPIMRLINCLEEANHYSLGKLLEYYCWFLDLMSDQNTREELAKIDHKKRYEKGNHLYYAVKLNSDMIHAHINKIISDLDPNSRQKILDWFLL